GRSSLGASLGAARGPVPRGVSPLPTPRGRPSLAARPGPARVGPRRPVRRPRRVPDRDGPPPIAPRDRMAGRAPPSPPPPEGRRERLAPPCHLARRGRRGRRPADPPGL